MKYLGLALYAEGPTDHEFLSPLLLRVCEDLALRSGQPIELSKVSLDRVREVPSWQRFETELFEVLHELRILQ